MSERFQIAKDSQDTRLIIEKDGYVTEDGKTYDAIIAEIYDTKAFQRFLEDLVREALKDGIVSRSKIRGE